jgi:hypothetical protein
MQNTSSERPNTFSYYIYIVFLTIQPLKKCEVTMDLWFVFSLGEQRSKAILGLFFSYFLLKNAVTRSHVSVCNQAAY